MELLGLQPAQILITSHLGADFDSFGSLIGGSCCLKTTESQNEKQAFNLSRPILIWPQSNEDAMNSFVKDNEEILRTKYNFFRSLKEVPEWQIRVKCLVVVDTRKISRLKHIQELLEYFGIGINELPSKEKIQVVVIDHHPPTELDIQAHQVIHHLWGSATSILVNELIQKNNGSLDINGQEATWMILGIYNDTGAFTYASTTHHDLSAAASLRAISDIDMIFVQNYMHQMFQRNQSLQNPSLMADEDTFKIILQMQHTAKAHTIYDHSLVICHVILPDYVRNFSTVVESFSEQHHDIINLLVLARFGAQVVIIGRSKKLSSLDGGIDMGLLCKAFGGGGHFGAASATVKNLSFHQVIEELFAHLSYLCGPKYSVSQLMTKSPILLTSNQSLGDAIQVFQDHSIKNIPVISESKFVGVVDRAIAFQSATHSKEWQSEPISNIIVKDINTLPQEAPFEQAIELIHRKHQRIVPIIDQSGMVIGIISRADIVNHFLKVRSQFSERPINQANSVKNIKDSLQKRLSPSLLGILHTIGTTADNYHARVYLIGKALRAILTETPIPSKLDILLESDSLSSNDHLIKDITQVLVLKHAVVTQSESDSVMLAHCSLKSSEDVDIKIMLGKLEQYPHLMSIPIAHVTPLTMQLYRKCFTVDAIAVSINQGDSQFGKFYDAFSASEDVASKTIEVIDSLAFLEAPKRIFKAIVLEQNGFTMGKNCERLIKSAITQFHVIDNMDGSSLFAVFKSILEHPHSSTIVDRLHYFQALKPIQGAFHTKFIHMQDSLNNLLHIIQLVTPLFHEMSNVTRWKLSFLALTHPLSDEELNELMTRLSMDLDTQRFFHETRHKVIYLTNKVKQTEKEMKGNPDGTRMVEALREEMRRQHINKEGILMAMSLRQDAIKFYVACMAMYNNVIEE